MHVADRRCSGWWCTYLGREATHVSAAVLPLGRIVGLYTLSLSRPGKTRQPRIPSEVEEAKAMATDQELGFPSGTANERELLLRWLGYLRGAVMRGRLLNSLSCFGLACSDRHWS